jgi:hypothetical protein
MDPGMTNTPRGRPLETNGIDHIIRCYGGRTIAIEMEPRQMQNSKKSRNVVRYIDFLNRRNGELRLELTFYRECYRHAEMFQEKIAETSQDLLHACIIGLLDVMAFDEIRDLSKSVVDAVDQFCHDQEKVFDDYIALYKASKSSKHNTTSTDGFI